MPLKERGFLALPMTTTGNLCSPVPFAQVIIVSLSLEALYPGAQRSFLRDWVHVGRHFQYRPRLIRIVNLFWQKSFINHKFFKVPNELLSRFRIPTQQLAFYSDIAETLSVFKAGNPPRRSVKITFQTKSVIKNLAFVIQIGPDSGDPWARCCENHSDNWSSSSNVHFYIVLWFAKLKLV